MDAPQWVFPSTVDKTGNIDKAIFDRLSPLEMMVIDFPSRINTSGMLKHGDCALGGA